MVVQTVHCCIVIGQASRKFICGLLQWTHEFMTDVLSGAQIVSLVWASLTSAEVLTTVLGEALRTQAVQVSTLQFTSHAQFCCEAKEMKQVLYFRNILR